MLQFLKFVDALRADGTEGVVALDGVAPVQHLVLTQRRHRMKILRRRTSPHGLSLQFNII